jgi:hypothetical protein
MKGFKQGLFGIFFFFFVHYNGLLDYLFEIKGGFHKSWVHGVKRKAHPTLGKNAISWA